MTQTKKITTWERHTALANALKKGEINRFRFWRLLREELEHFPESYCNSSYDFLGEGRFPRIGKDVRPGIGAMEKLDRDEVKLLFLARNLYASANGNLLKWTIDDFNNREVQNTAYEIIAREFIKLAEPFSEDFEKRFKYDFVLPHYLGDLINKWPYRTREGTWSASFYNLSPFIEEVKINLEWLSERKDLDKENRRIGREISELKRNYASLEKKFGIGFVA